MALGTDMQSNEAHLVTRSNFLNCCHRVLAVFKNHFADAVSVFPQCGSAAGFCVFALAKLCNYVNSVVCELSVFMLTYAL